ncbi:hypothetical protein A176_004883 [Myxococcus hansupus]|uniref:HIT domain-containing protein n=1 Tax=Pseudomyxococcus hansupus TaxID=1297742 RepID=A0A0H4WX45_9BACT|nr:hypothetical protein [Myxococcus hansupus]AKQ67971.1 hypothetical protein A176_004883 [Myxococcus hansupus]
MSECPFCRIAGHERVLFTLPGARVLCDARPALVGHVLVVSESHVPSAEDLDGLEYLRLRLAQQEAAARVHAVFGEVGVYEHGRSAICRFHCADRGDTHAHAHVVPISCDLVERTGFISRLGTRPAAEQLVETDRYVYQESGPLPGATWGFGGGHVRRHFVRSELHRVLEERNTRWVPLDAPPSEHRETNEESIRLLGVPATPARSCVVTGREPGLVEAAAREVAQRLGWALVRPQALLRRVAHHETLSPGQLLPSVVAALSRAVERGAVRPGLDDSAAESASPELLAREEQLARDPGVWAQLDGLLQAVLRASPSVLADTRPAVAPRVPGAGLVVRLSEGAARPAGSSWQERHVDTAGLTPVQVAACVVQAWELRLAATSPESLIAAG